MATNWSNVTAGMDFLRIPNTNTGGYFWVAMLYLIWFVLLILFSSFGIEVALLASAFIALIVSILLVYMELIAWQFTLFFLGILLITFIYIIYSSNRDA